MWWRNYSQTLFYKMKIDYISGSTALNFKQFSFIVCPSCRLPAQYIETKVLATCFYLILSFFEKWEEVCNSHFLYNF